LPDNRWTLAAADSVATAGYWLGFLVAIATEAFQYVARALRGVRGS